MTPVEFGIFDHVDRGEAPLAALYADRLAFVEAADAAGFRTYHVAEHHATRLGMAPSPGVYLAAVAQRTRRLARALRPRGHAALQERLSP